MKTVEQARKELNEAIDRETKKLHKAMKPYWEALDKACAQDKIKRSRSE